MMEVEIVSAIGGMKTTLEVAPSITFGELKRIIANRRRIPESTFVLAFKGMEQMDSTTLKEAGCVEKDKVYLITRTEGGHP
ncbi:MAG: ubiquitin-like protein [Promethearchaeota archaeon]